MEVLSNFDQGEHSLVPDYEIVVLSASEVTKMQMNALNQSKDILFVEIAKRRPPPTVKPVSQLIAQRSFPVHGDIVRGRIDEIEQWAKDSSLMCHGTEGFLLKVSNQINNSNFSNRTLVCCDKLCSYAVRFVEYPYLHCPLFTYAILIPFAHSQRCSIAGHSALQDRRNNILFPIEKDFVSTVLQGLDVSSEQVDFHALFNSLGLVPADLTELRLGAIGAKRKQAEIEKKVFNNGKVARYYKDCKHVSPVLIQLVERHQRIPPMPHKLTVISTMESAAAPDSGDVCAQLAELCSAVSITRPVAETASFSRDVVDLLPQVTTAVPLPAVVVASAPPLVSEICSLPPATAATTAATAALVTSAVPVLASRARTMRSSKTTLLVGQGLDEPDVVFDVEVKGIAHLEGNIVSTGDVSMPMNQAQKAYDTLDNFVAMPVHGILNPSNYCALTVSVQMILRINPLVHFFEQILEDHVNIVDTSSPFRGHVAAAFCNLIAAYRKHHTKNGAFCLHSFKMEVKDSLKVVGITIHAHAAEKAISTRRSAVPVLPVQPYIDAAELTSKLLQLLHNDIGPNDPVVGCTPPHHLIGVPNVKVKHNIVSDTCQVYLSSHWHCTHCGLYDFGSDVCADFVLPVDVNAQPMNWQQEPDPVSLESCIDFTSAASPALCPKFERDRDAELARHKQIHTGCKVTAYDDNCANWVAERTKNCQPHLDCTCRSTIRASGPRYLLLHLHLFRGAGEAGTEMRDKETGEIMYKPGTTEPVGFVRWDGWKLNDRISMPLRAPILAHMAANPLLPPPLLCEKYELVAFFTHHEDVGDGHFTSSVKYKDDWKFCDDTNVMELRKATKKFRMAPAFLEDSLDDAHSTLETRAYVVMYKLLHY